MLVCSGNQHSICVAMSGHFHRIILTLMISFYGSESLHVIRTRTDADIFTNPSCQRSECIAKSAHVSPYSQCDCQCRENTAVYNQRTGECLSSIEGCGDISLRNGTAIPGLSLPATGSDIIPRSFLIHSASNTSLGVDNSCEVASTRYLGQDGWTNLSRLTAARPRLDSQRTEIYLQWLAETETSSSLDGHLLKIFLKCQNSAANSTKTYCFPVKITGKLTVHGSVKPEANTQEYTILIGVVSGVAVLTLACVSLLCLWKRRPGIIFNKDRSKENYDDISSKEAARKQTLNGHTVRVLSDQEHLQKLAEKKRLFHVDIVRPVKADTPEMHYNSTADPLGPAHFPGPIFTVQHQFNNRTWSSSHFSKHESNLNKYFDGQTPTDERSTGVNAKVSSAVERREKKVKTKSLGKSAVGSLRRMFGLKLEEKKERKARPKTISGVPLLLEEEYRAMDHYQNGGVPSRGDGFILMDDRMKEMYLDKLQPRNNLPESTDVPKRGNAYVKRNTGTADRLNVIGEPLKRLRPISIPSDQDDSGYQSSPLVTPTGQKYKQRPGESESIVPITNIDDIMNGDSVDSSSNVVVTSEVSKRPSLMSYRWTNGAVNGPTSDENSDVSKTSGRDVLDHEDKYLSATNKKIVSRSFDVFKRPAQYLDKKVVFLDSNHNYTNGGRGTYKFEKLDKKLSRPKSAQPSSDYIVQKTDDKSTTSSEPKKQGVKSLRERFEAFVEKDDGLNFAERETSIEKQSEKRASLIESQTPPEQPIAMRKQVPSIEKQSEKRVPLFESQTPPEQPVAMKKQVHFHQSDANGDAVPRRHSYRYNRGIEFMDTCIMPTMQPSMQPIKIKPPPQRRQPTRTIGRDKAVFDARKQTDVAVDVSQLFYDDKLSQRKASEKSLKFGKVQVFADTKC